MAFVCSRGWEMHFVNSGTVWWRSSKDAVKSVSLTLPSPPFSCCSLSISQLYLPLLVLTLVEATLSHCVKRCSWLLSSPWRWWSRKMRPPLSCSLPPVSEPIPESSLLDQMPTHTPRGNSCVHGDRVFYWPLSHVPMLPGRQGMLLYDADTTATNISSPPSTISIKNNLAIEVYVLLSINW